MDKKIWRAVPVKLVKLLRFIGEMAEVKGYSAFIVGGFVRDRILGVKNFDVDIVIEGDAIDFSRSFADEVKGALVVHHKFGTATVVMPWSIAKDKRFKVDIATARKERYRAPAALPDVEFSSLRDDLYRRDFTINAMAIALSRDSFGQFIDFFDGLGDIRKGVVSVLHKGSFIDDPTRIFRAVRFEQRFGFRIDKHTEDLIKTAIDEDMFGRTERQRIRDELILMLNERDPVKAVMRMHQLDELRFIHPNIKIGKDLKRLFKSIKERYDWYMTSPLKAKNLDLWLIYLMALLSDLDKKGVRDLCGKFVFSRNDKIRLISCKDSCDKILQFLSRKKHLRPSEIYKRLRPLSCETILFMMAKAKGDKVKARIGDFLMKSKDVKIKAKGMDLKRMGLKEGPAIGRILGQILYAKIDGEVSSKSEELTYARRLL